VVLQRKLIEARGAVEHNGAYSGIGLRMTY